MKYNMKLLRMGSCQKAQEVGLWVNISIPDRTDLKKHWIAGRTGWQSCWNSYKREDTEDA